MALLYGIKTHNAKFTDNEGNQGAVSEQNLGFSIIKLSLKYEYNSFRVYKACGYRLTSKCHEVPCKYSESST